MFKNEVGNQGNGGQRRDSSQGQIPANSTPRGYQVNGDQRRDQQQNYRAQQLDHRQSSSPSPPRENRQNGEQRRGDEQLAQRQIPGPSAPRAPPTPAQVPLHENPYGEDYTYQCQGLIWRQALRKRSECDGVIGPEGIVVSGHIRSPRKVDQYYFDLYARRTHNARYYERCQKIIQGLEEENGRKIKNWKNIVVMKYIKNDPATDQAKKIHKLHLAFLEAEERAKRRAALDLQAQERAALARQRAALARQGVAPALQGAAPARQGAAPAHQGANPLKRKGTDVEESDDDVIFEKEITAEEKAKEEKAVKKMKREKRREVRKEEEEEVAEEPARDPPSFLRLNCIKTLAEIKAEYGEDFKSKMLSREEIFDVPPHHDQQ